MSGKYRAAVGRPRDLRRQMRRVVVVIFQHITIYYTLQTPDYELSTRLPLGGAIRKRLLLTQRKVSGGIGHSVSVADAAAAVRIRVFTRPLTDLLNDR